MSDIVESYRKRRDARLALKKDGGPGSGKKPKGGSQSASGSSNSTKTATPEKFEKFLKSFKNSTEFKNRAQEVYDEMPVNEGLEFDYGYRDYDYCLKQPDGSLKWGTTNPDRPEESIVPPHKAAMFIRNAVNGAHIRQIVTTKGSLYGGGYDVMSRSGEGLG